MNELLVDEGVNEVDVTLEQRPKQAFVTFVQMFGKFVEPRIRLHFPAEGSRLHINHTASRDLAEVRRMEVKEVAMERESWPVKCPFKKPHSP